MSRFRNPAYRAIVALLLIGTSGTGLAAQTPDSASVQTLLDNWAEALGGREALDKLQTWQHVSAAEMFGM